MTGILLYLILVLGEVTTGLSALEDWLRRDRRNKLILLFLVLTLIWFWRKD